MCGQCGHGAHKLSQRTRDGTIVAECLKCATKSLILVSSKLMIAWFDGNQLGVLAPGKPKS